MAIDLGFAELVDRVEKHIGPKPTKLLMWVTWLFAIGFLLNGIFGYVIEPLIKVGPNVSKALQWTDYIRIAFTLLVGFSTGSSLLEAYRMKLLRAELEDMTGGANNLLDDIRDFRQRARAELDQDIASAKQLINEAGENILRTRELQRTAQMMAEDIYAIGAESQVMPEALLADFRQLIDDFREAGSDLDRDGAALREVNP